LAESRAKRRATRARLIQRVASFSDEMRMRIIRLGDKRAADNENTMITKTCLCHRWKCRERPRAGDESSNLWKLQFVPPRARFSYSNPARVNGEFTHSRVNAEISPLRQIIMRRHIYREPVAYIRESERKRKTLIARGLLIHSHINFYLRQELSVLRQVPFSVPNGA